MHYTQIAYTLNTFDAKPSMIEDKATFPEYQDILLCLDLRFSDQLFLRRDEYLLPPYLREPKFNTVDMDMIFTREVFPGTWAFLLCF